MADKLKLEAIHYRGDLLTPVDSEARESIEKLRANVASNFYTIDSIDSKVAEINYKINEEARKVNNKFEQVLGSGLKESLDSLKEIADLAEVNKNEIAELKTTSQEILVSGKNIKTVDGESILGSGNISLDKYLTKKEDELNRKSYQRYEVTNFPEGTLFDYRENEIRVYCPSNVIFTQQNGKEPNKHYIGLRIYAPKGTEFFKEDIADKIYDETLYRFDDNDFAGRDEYGRNYSLVWLPVAEKTVDGWNYFGNSSTLEHYIGWNYCAEWYSIDNKLLGVDNVKIILTNKDTFANNMDFYIGDVKTEIISNINDVKSTLESNINSVSTTLDQKIDQRINEISGSDLTEKLDTIKEIAESLNNDPQFFVTVKSELDKKADSEDVYTKAQSDNIISNYALKTELFSRDYNDLKNKPTGMATESYVDKKVADLVGSAPETLDTLKELADELKEHSGQILDVVNDKASKTEVDAVSLRVKELEDNPYVLPEDVVEDSNYRHITVTANFVSDGVATFTKYDDTDLVERLGAAEDELDLVDSKISNSLVDYAKKEELFSKDYNDLENKPTIPSLDGYATEAWVENKKYLTEHQSLDEYALKTELFSKDYNDLSNKPTIPSVEGLASENYVDTKISELVGTAPETLDTIHEIAAALSGQDSVIESLETVIGSKVNTETFNAHVNNIENPHGVTKEQIGLGNVENVAAYSKENIDAMVAQISAELSLKANKDSIPSSTAELTNNSDFTTNAYVDSVKDDLNEEIAKKATSGALTELSTTVSGLGTRVGSVETSLSSKAAASELNTLKTTVDNMKTVTLFSGGSGSVKLSSSISGFKMLFVRGYINGFLNNRCFSIVLDPQVLESSAVTVVIGDEEIKNNAYTGYGAAVNVEFAYNKSTLYLYTNKAMRHWYHESGFGGTVDIIIQNVIGLR